MHTAAKKWCFTALTFHTPTHCGWFSSTHLCTCSHKLASKGKDTEDDIRTTVVTEDDDLRRNNERQCNGFEGYTWQSGRWDGAKQGRGRGRGKGERVEKLLRTRPFCGVRKNLKLQLYSSGLHRARRRQCLKAIRKEPQCLASFLMAPGAQGEGQATVRNAHNLPLLLRMPVCKAIRSSITHNTVHGMHTLISVFPKRSSPSASSSPATPAGRPPHRPSPTVGAAAAGRKTRTCLSLLQWHHVPAECRIGEAQGDGDGQDIAAGKEARSSTEEDRKVTVPSETRVTASTEALKDRWGRNDE